MKSESDIIAAGFVKIDGCWVKPPKKSKRPTMTPENVAALNKIDNVLFGWNLPETISTPEIESEVRDLHLPFKRILETRGIFYAYSRSDRATGQREGIPDFLLAVDGVPIAVEFKRPGQKPRKEQRECMEEMQRNGWRVSVQTSVQEAWKWVCENSLAK